MAETTPRKSHYTKRQYLHYCREHREKLSKDLEARSTTEALSEPKMRTTFLAVQDQQSEVVSETQTVTSRPTSPLAPTTASTVVPAKLAHLEKLEEQNEDDRESQWKHGRINCGNQEFFESKLE